MRKAAAGLAGGIELPLADAPQASW